MISSPYDPEAHYAKQQTPSWIGDKVHVTESCEQDKRHLIPHVETTAAPMADAEATPLIHAALAEQPLLPHLHIADTGYLEAELLVTSKQQHGVEVLGPTRPDDRGQARAGQGFDAGSLGIDWEQRQALWPMGQRSSRGSPVIDQRNHAVITMKCSARDGQACPRRIDCTRATRRTVTVRPHEPHLSLQAARPREPTEADKAQYATRAGIEGTLSQAVRAFGVRRARYMGAANTPLQHVLTAAAINFVRVGVWLAGDRPAAVRQSRFQALLAHPAAAA
jgi:transposase